MQINVVLLWQAIMDRSCYMILEEMVSQGSFSKRPYLIDAGTMMLLWASTVHADKRTAIARAIHFYDNHQKVLIFMLETGEMWDKIDSTFDSLSYLPRICRDIESGKEDWHKILKSGMWVWWLSDKEQCTKIFSRGNTAIWGFCWGSYCCDMQKWSWKTLFFLHSLTWSSSGYQTS